MGIRKQFPPVMMLFFAASVSEFVRIGVAFRLRQSELEPYGSLHKTCGLTLNYYGSGYFSTCLGDENKTK